MRIEVIGVYPVDDALQACHIVELWVRDLNGRLYVDQFTQENPDQPSMNWQAPYDERVLNEQGDAQVGDRFPGKIIANGDLRLAFFFHFLDFSKPLRAPRPADAVSLPEPTERPARLDFMEYEEP